MNIAIESEPDWTATLKKMLFSDLVREDISGLQDLLLAHYTTISTLESIVKNNEVWFSNPLFMNDIEEVRFCVNTGASVFRQSEELRDACGSDQNHSAFLDRFNLLYERFEQEHLIHTFVFCLTEHEKSNFDGKLSMWRGYGQNGIGAAIVFDASSVVLTGNSPFIISKILYESRDARVARLEGMVTIACNILRENSIDATNIHWVSYWCFECLKFFSLFSKHEGFSEEKEWRIVYFPERDVGNKFGKCIGYNIRNSVEPKLKLPLSEFKAEYGIDLSLSRIVKSIILGPTSSTPLAKACISEMLNILNVDLISKIETSSIPFRCQ